MNITEMNLIEIEARLAVMDSLLEAAEAPIEGFEDEKRALLARKAELTELEQRKADAEALNNGEVRADRIVETREVREEIDMNEMEVRAAELVANNKMEVRALLSSGTIAKPTKVGGINGVADLNSSIVDDVTAVGLTGNGAYVVAYQKTRAIAANVTDGSAIGGTEATFDIVTINPAEWGIFGQISHQVKKVSPLNYMNALENSAIVALRAMAESKIFAALAASSLTEAKATVALDKDYLRTIALGFKSIDGKGGTKLYLSQGDLITLGQVRGTNEKRALFDIAFDEGSNTNGTISEGGLAVRFSVSDALTDGTQYYGQPATIEMPMWDGMELTTDESRYFELNLIAYRGIQTAGADLCALHGMQKITQ